MGRMKELYIKILEANNDKLPYNLTLSDVSKMKELDIYEWYAYNKAISKESSFYIKDKFEVYINEDSIKIRKDHESNLRRKNESGY
jgi:hypothetical protein